MGISKRCKRCSNDLLLEFFHKNKQTPDGLNIYCKTCSREQVDLSRARQKALVEKGKRAEDIPNRDPYVVNGEKGISLRCTHCNGKLFVLTD